MQGEKVIIRVALHAGSWYNQSQVKLAEELKKNLDQAKIEKKQIVGKVKAIIGPHAGFRYSGPVAAWSYKYLEQHKSNDKLRVFLLGPSHYKYLQGVSLSTCTQLQTPIGNLAVDTATIQKLRNEIPNIPMSKKDEEKQHSLEMHMPFIKHTMGAAKVIPIIVGDMKGDLLQKLGTSLAPYFDDENTIFVISSDFCHWGEHFDYQPFDGKGQIWQYIKNLDHQGMKLIEKQDLSEFKAYLNQTQNTICGRNPISLLLNIISHSKHKFGTQFVQYDQSEPVKSMDQSSVSYAAGVTFLIG